MVNTLNGLGSPSREEKLSQLEKIISSRTFQGAEILKSFLRFVVNKSIEGLESELKEYTIATEVFGRKGDYDPRIDSLVRVQAARLRSKLEEYYLIEGKSDPIRIQLPKGHYVPLFTYAKITSEQLNPIGIFSFWRESPRLEPKPAPSTSANLRVLRN